MKVGADRDVGEPEHSTGRDGTDKTLSVIPPTHDEPDEDGKQSGHDVVQHVSMNVGESELPSSVVVG